MRRFLTGTLIVLSLWVLAASPAVAQPEQIHLGCVSDPSTSITVGWVTIAPGTKAEVRYGIDETDLNTTVAGSIVPLANITPGTHHEVTLTGLSPNTRYYYQCGNENTGWSDVRAFKTAPVPGQYADFKFTALGDQGVTTEAAMAAQLCMDEDPDFHFVLGDLSYANGTQPIWNDWFVLNEDLFSRYLTWHVIGNHDDESNYGVTTYTNRLALPGNERWYTYTWARTRFICLDTESLYIQFTPQYTFAEEELRKARQDRDIDWIIVVFHKPQFAGAEGRSGEWQMALTLTPLFEQYGVDLVLTGHDHLFMQTYPMRSTLPTTLEKTNYVDPQGIVHVISGAGGKSLYTKGDWSYAAFITDQYQYVRVEITMDGKLTLTAISSLTGMPFHTFSISKTRVAVTPTPGPTRTPTQTPTPTDTPTLTPTETPTPTLTPGPITGVDLNATFTSTSRQLDLDLHVWNKHTAQVVADLYIAVEVAGTFYFYPAFTEAVSPLVSQAALPPGIDTGWFTLAELPLGDAVLPAPVTVVWYGALIDSANGTLIGDLASDDVTLE